MGLSSALATAMSGLSANQAALAIIGDFVPFGIGQALGKRAHEVSARRSRNGWRLGRSWTGPAATGSR